MTYLELQIDAAKKCDEYEDFLEHLLSRKNYLPYLEWISTKYYLKITQDRIKQLEKNEDYESEQSLLMLQNRENKLINLLFTNNPINND
jgi:hypothetical protein